MHWTLTFLGNLAGSLFIMAIIIGYGGVFDAPAYASEVRAFVTTKQVTPQWHQIFLKGIGANWLVCLACFLGLSGREYVSKIVGIWWPTFAFISLGFDHGMSLFSESLEKKMLMSVPVVANMFIVPMGIWLNTPHLTVGTYVWKGIIPAGLGNIIGGGLFVGTYFYYQYLQGVDAPLIDGDGFDASPMGLMDFRSARVDLGRQPAVHEEETVGVPSGNSTPASKPQA